MDDSSASVSPWRGWRDWSVGIRVMVRTRLPEGSSHLYTDTLGTVVQVDDSGLVLRRRDEVEVTVPAATIMTGKPVPPAPPRRGRREPPAL